MGFDNIVDIPDDAFDEPKTDYKKQGKRNRATGRDTEKRIRKDLQEDGWIVSNWRNNVKDNKLVVAKNMFMRGRGVMLGAGFPDFIAFRKKGKFHEVIGVECKTDGRLNQIEKDKCKWLLENKVFSKILIASREYDGRYVVIKYKEFEVKNG